MALYKHHISTHKRAKRAGRVKRLAQIAIVLMLLAGLVIGIDWLLSNIRSSQTVVSRESNATVQSAQINIFRTPYFQFEADSSWREVTDELNLKNQASGYQQYLYRSFKKDFIEHELWITVNLPKDYTLERHNIPTRVLPVSVEADGSLRLLGQISKPCGEELPAGDTNLQPHVITQSDISYYCFPNQLNDYTVTIGTPGGTNDLISPNNSDGKQDTVAITYRNVTAIPDPSSFERILRKFRLL